MTRASAFFSADEVRRIEEAVAEAEAHTTGEIVPVIATASGRYDRAEDLFGFLVAAGALSLAWLLFQGVEAPAGEWSAGPRLALGLGWVLAILFCGFVGGAVAATYLPALRLPFIRRAEMEEEVERSAAAAFHRARIRATTGASGILLYVSLYERMVRVLGDDAIAARLSASDWEDVCGLVVEGLRSGDGAGGLIRAIGRAGELLATHFPADPQTPNQIPNRLVFVD